MSRMMIERNKYTDPYKNKTSAIQKFAFLTSNKDVMRPRNIAKFV